jgi:hypothetical protein
MLAKYAQGVYGVNPVNAACCEKAESRQEMSSAVCIMVRSRLHMLVAVPAIAFEVLWESWQSKSSL